MLESKLDQSPGWNPDLLARDEERGAEPYQGSLLSPPRHYVSLSYRGSCPLLKILWRRRSPPSVPAATRLPAERFRSESNRAAGAEVGEDSRL